MNLVGVAISQHALEKYQTLHCGGAPARWDKAILGPLADARRVKFLRSSRAVRNFLKYHQGADYYESSGLWFVLSVDRPRLVITCYRAENLVHGLDWKHDGHFEGR